MRISELKPEEKKPYYVIDKIVINDPDFINTPILFNENLTCIIGGKSTGKSVLLNNIANTIDSSQVANKLSIANNDRILSATYPSPKLVVKWRDGTESTKADVHNRKIVYIPQTYLNRLADIVRTLKSRELPVIAGRMNFRNVNDDIVKIMGSSKENFRIAYKKFWMGFPHPATIVPKMIYEKYGYYNEKFAIMADLDWFRRMYEAKVNVLFIDGEVCLLLINLLYLPTH